MSKLNYCGLKACNFVLFLQKLISMHRKYFLVYFLVFQLFFLKIIRFFPDWVEKFYSNFVYQKIAISLRFTLGKIAFSVGDVLYMLPMIWIVRTSFCFFKQKNKHWKNGILHCLNFFSVIYFLFHLLWGLNYYRQPIAQKFQITTDYTNTDLLLFTQKLIAKTNASQLQITKIASQKVTFPYTSEQVFEKNLVAYQNLEADFPFLAYKNPSIKNSLFSLPLTYMGFGGYLNPFTNEAQLNYLLPKHTLPTTSCHEMAHQMGYASESDCNFIAFLVSVNSSDLYYNYSGCSVALRYCLANWQVRNEKTYQQLLLKINPGVLKNYQESQDFWLQYQTPVETAFHAFYDQFLKINQQKDGMQSYSKFVDLMVNYYKTKPL